MQSDTVTVILLIIAALALFVATLGFGYILGYRGWQVSAIFDVLSDLSKRKPEEKGESAIVDDSPTARAERKRAGKDKVDDDESQIITVKSRRQREKEANAAREAELDKWMPGAKE